MTSALRPKNQKDYIKKYLKTKLDHLLWISSYFIHNIFLLIFSLFLSIVRL